jgi:uncharacterized protein
MLMIICLTSLGASLLTLFSGFGLGTILLPVFALFFPLPVAIGATAIVHVSNNLFKVFLVGRNADWKTVIRFAVPASLAALFGALLLKSLSALPDITSYRIGQHAFDVTAIKLTIGILIVLFALMELLPQFKKLSFPPKFLPIGGLLSGFFGGLSGLQGALRSAFLIRVGLSKEKFIGTGVMAAIIVDFSRLLVYGLSFYSLKFGMVKNGTWGLVVCAAVSAFIGAYFGKLLMKKVSIDVIEKIVGILLIIMGISLSAGII